MFNIVFGICYLVWGMFCLSIWQKSRDKNFLLLVWLSAIGFLAELIDYFLRYVSNASTQILLISNSFFL